MRKLANGGGVDYTDYNSLLEEERRLFAEYNKVKADYDREYKEDEFDSLLAQEYKQKMEMLEGKLKEVNNDLLYIQTHGIEKSFGGDYEYANGGGVGKKYYGWVDISVENPQMTRPYYEDRVYAKGRTKAELKEDVIKKLIEKGDSPKFVKTFTINITGKKYANGGEM